MKKIISYLIILVLVVQVLVACSSNEENPVNETTTDADSVTGENLDETSGQDQASVEMTYTPGTYEGSGQGKDGEIIVDVTFSEHAIESIELIDSNESEGIGAKAIPELIESIESNQSLAVDTVSGASETTEGLKAAIEDAVEQAGANPDLLYNVSVAKENDGVTEEKTADVVVVGAGASGVSAAVAAADEGAKVIIIEKTDTIGGASNLSWAAKFYNSSASVNQGLVIDTDEEAKEWIENNHWRVSAANIRQYINKSGETYDWLAEKGYSTSFLNFAGDPLHVLPNYDQREGMLRTMLEASVISGGGEVLTGTTGKSLITDEEGNVVGITAEEKDGTILTINAEAVILATGGYAANAEMVKEYNGFEGVNGGLGQNVGEGLQMAWDAGAGVPDNIGTQMLHQTIVVGTDELKEEFTPFEGSYPLMMSYLPTLLNVGPSGARFRDETATLVADQAANTSAYNGPYHYVIVTKKQVEDLMEGGMANIDMDQLPGMPPETYSDFADQFQLDMPWDNLTEVLDAMVEVGAGYKGDTLEDLANAAGMDTDTFLNNYQSYKTSVEDGVDHEFGKDASYLYPLGEEGPYYAIKAQINNLGSIGGLLVDVDFKVLTNDHIPVNGLYAVGVISEGGLFGDAYIGNGDGVGYAFTSGRLGGKIAADEVLDIE